MANITLKFNFLTPVPQDEILIISTRIEQALNMESCGHSSSGLEKVGITELSKTGDPKVEEGRISKYLKNCIPGFETIEKSRENGRYEFDVSPLPPALK